MEAAEAEVLKPDKASSLDMDESYDTVDKMVSIRRPAGRMKTLVAGPLSVARICLVSERAVPDRGAGEGKSSARERH